MPAANAEVTTVMVRTIKPKIQLRPRRISSRGRGERTQNLNPERSNPKMFEAKVDPMNAEKTAKLNKYGPWSDSPPNVSDSLVRIDLASGPADFARGTSIGAAGGTSIGAAVGASIGTSVSSAEGSTVGTTAGSAVGSAVGSAGRSVVGLVVGFDVVCSGEAGEETAGGGGISR